MPNQKRGELLLSVRTPMADWQVAAIVVVAVTLVYVVARIVYLRPARFWDQLGEVVFWIGYIGLFTVPRRIKFYEKGMRYIQPANSRYLRFVSWEQLERYQFEGDLLILTGTDSTLKGGPVAGGVFRLRPEDKPRVEAILAQYLPAKV